MYSEFASSLEAFPTDRVTLFLKDESSLEGGANFSSSGGSGSGSGSGREASSSSTVPDEEGEPTLIPPPPPNRPEDTKITATIIRKSKIQRPSCTIPPPPLPLLSLLLSLLGAFPLGMA